MLTTRHGDVMFEYEPLPACLARETGQGWSTLAYLVRTDEHGNVLSSVSGCSICHPHDRFQRRIGRKIALARAIHDLPRETRREIWEDLWAQGVGK